MMQFQVVHSQRKKNQHTQKNTIKKTQATLVDPARKRSGLLYTGPGTTRARLPVSRFACFLSSARGRRQHRIKSVKFHRVLSKNQLQHFFIDDSVAQRLKYVIPTEYKLTVQSTQLLHSPSTTRYVQVMWSDSSVPCIIYNPNNI